MCLVACFEGQKLEGVPATQTFNIRFARTGIYNAERFGTNLAQARVIYGAPALVNGRTFEPAFGSHHCAQLSIIARRFSSASPLR